MGKTKELSKYICVGLIFLISIAFCFIYVNDNVLTVRAGVSLSYTYNEDYSCYAVSSYDGTNPDIMVATTYNDGIHGDGTVRLIDNSVFQNSSLSSIVIPSTITRIGESAFNGCTSLVSVSFSGPSTLEYIGNDAFYNCSSLISFEIPANVTTIGYNAFVNCSLLSTITIPAGISSIGEYTFSGCSELESVIFDCAYLTTINDYAFSDCTALRNITIPSTVNSIESSVFKNCSSLVSVTIPANITTIKEYTFSGCSALSSVTFDCTNLTIIDIFAFSDCTSLTSFTIPSTVEGIGTSAFESCSNLTLITIPTSLTTIGDYAFSECSSLPSVTIPAGVSMIKAYTFNGCTNLGTVTFDCTNLTSIYDFAFNDCTSLTSIIIPSTVGSIGASAFRNCSSLVSVKIPANVTLINGYTFNGCTALESVIFNCTNLTTISDYAFNGCAVLTSFTIPSTVTSIQIGAFYNCSSLSSVTIPAGITTINNSVFAVCTALESVVFNCTDLTSINNFAFYSCSSLASVSIPSTVGSIGASAFRNCSNLVSVTIPTNVTLINDYTFNGCSALESVIFNCTNLTSIGNYAFSGCAVLHSVTIPSTVTNIESDVFYGSGINKLYVEPITPPSLANANMIDNEETKIIVPRSSLDDYKTSTNWSSLSSQIYADYFVITYILNDGTNDVNNPNTYTIDSETITLLAPTKEGNVFQGWYEESDFSGSPIVQIAQGSTGDLTLYASWTAIEYTITYTLNGGENAVGNPINYNVSTPTFSILAPTRPGYTFQNWYSDEDLTTLADTTIELGSTGNISLYADFTAINYTITYELNSGTNFDNAPTNYTIESSTIILGDATRTGYTFSGWFTTSDFQEGTEISEIVSGSTGDISVYASFTITTYTITLHLNDGFGNTNTINYTIASETFALNSLFRAGYYFNGWYDNQELAGDIVTEITQGTSGDIDLYASFTVNSYNITFEENGGSEVENLSEDYGTSITLPNPTKTGYNFVGWFVNSDLTGDAVSYNTMPAQSLILYAGWEAIEVTISFNVNGGEEVVSLTDGYNSLITLPTPTKVGYIFTGWYFDEDCTNEANLTTMPSENVTLYAGWEVSTNLNWLWILLGIIGLLGIGMVVVLLFLQSKIIFVRDDKVLFVLKYKFNKEITIPSNLKKYKWYKDRELTKEYTPAKMGIKSFVIYSRSKSSAKKKD